MAKKSNKVRDIVEAARAKAGEGAPLAIALHNHVRDEIAFGFTPYFDAASSEKTLDLRTGHCNPQARLMVDLFREAGFGARFRPATITNAILSGVAVTPPELSHVFTEVRMDGKWVRLDSYIADPALRSQSVKRLKAEGLDYGYGCHVSATGEWNGRHDSYSQIAGPETIVELHDPFDNLDEFYASANYKHRVGPISYSALFAPWRLFNSAATRVLNRRVESLRGS